MKLKSKVIEEYRKTQGQRIGVDTTVPTLQTKLCSLNDEISTVEALELRSEKVRESIIKAYEENCPKRQKTFRKPVYNIGRARSPLCRHCGREVETTEHVIKTCAAGGPSWTLKYIYREHLGPSSY